MRIRLQPSVPTPYLLPDMLPDESVSSWSRRIPQIQNLEGDISEGDRDFSKVKIEIPGLRPILAQQLRKAALPPDQWLVAEPFRLRFCPRCYFVDWATGVPHYVRRGWSVAWRTCCPQHGALVDFWRFDDELEFFFTVNAPTWNNSKVSIYPHRKKKPVFQVAIFADQRAQHLENALAGTPPHAWFPIGFTGRSLRTAYVHLVEALLAQFGLWERPACVEVARDPGRVYSAFAQQRSVTRFAINVIVEAIVSSWSGSPLPLPISKLRTALIVKALGWAIPAKQHPNQVLVDEPDFFKGRISPDQQDACARRFPAGVRAALRRQVRLFRLPSFTKREAEALGISTRAIRELEKITASGRLGRFDSSRGRIQREPFVEVLSERERFNMRWLPLEMPAWTEPWLMLENDPYQVNFLGNMRFRS